MSNRRWVKHLAREVEPGRDHGAAIQSQEPLGDHVDARPSERKLSLRMHDRTTGAQLLALVIEPCEFDDDFGGHRFPRRRVELIPSQDCGAPVAIARPVTSFGKSAVAAISVSYTTWNFAFASSSTCQTYLPS